MIYKILLMALITMLPTRAFELPANSTQCLVGIAADWDSSQVTLNFHEKNNGKWQAVSQPWAGRLGKNGLVWGKGVHVVPAGIATKKEGDNRSPAGIFNLGGVWGYDATIRKHPDLTYRQVTSRDLWVEDPASPKYNHHIILDHEPATAWEKKQQMKQSDAAHSLKLFIGHNAPPDVTPNAGSSIFFHIWRADGARATAGCTTMSKAKLQWVIAKMDPTRRPIYVLLTKADYEKYRFAWKLP